MADSKLTALTEDTNPTIDDLVYSVTDPAGTPVERKLTIENLLKLLTPGTFVDRGDPSAYDWTVGDFTTDGTWRDLDCSSIVPAGATHILFRVGITDDAVGSQFSLRKNGNSNAYNSGALKTQAVNIDLTSEVFVPCDSNQVVEYYGSNLTWTTINVVIKGWITNVSQSVLGFSDKLIDRGDLSAWDYDLGDLTTDNTWYDLDLSAIVPAGATHVYIKCQIGDNAAGSIMSFRKNGSAQAVQSAQVGTQVSGVTTRAQFLVPCDTNRIIEYRGSNVTFTDVYIAVLGWVVDSADNINKGLVLLEEVTESSGVASIDLENWYSSDYDEYQIEVLNLIPATDAAVLWMRMSTDGGSSYDSGANYGTAVFYIRDGSDSNALGDNSGANQILLSDGLSNTQAQGGVSGDFKLINPGSTTFYKTLNFHLSMIHSTSDYLYNMIGTGKYFSTTAVNAFQFLMSTGNITGTVRVYGVRK